MSNEDEDKREDDGAEDGQFVSGGNRAVPPPPPQLPPISDVEPGSIFQTAEGDLWKACKGEIFSPPKWDRALIVTPDEHRAVVRRSWMLLGAWLLLIVAAWVPMLLGFWVGTFLILAVWFVVGAAWVHAEGARRAHVVTPGMADLSA